MFLKKEDKILILQNYNKFYYQLKKKIDLKIKVKLIKIDKKKIKKINSKHNIVINILNTKNLESNYLSNKFLYIINKQKKILFGLNKNIVNIISTNDQFSNNISETTRKISKNFGRKNIRINSIILQRKLHNKEIDELNQFIIFLASSDASYISGTTITI